MPNSNCGDHASLASQPSAHPIDVVRAKDLADVVFEAIPLHDHGIKRAILVDLAVLEEGIPRVRTVYRLVDFTALSDEDQIILAQSSNDVTFSTYVQGIFVRIQRKIALQKYLGMGYTRLQRPGWRDVSVTLNTSYKGLDAVDIQKGQGVILGLPIASLSLFILSRSFNMSFIVSS